MSSRDRLAFALDFPTLAEAEAAAREVAPSVGVLKVGLELFVHEGPAAVALGRALGRDVFLDLKLHDIPETVERAVTRARALGVRYLTVHAAGGTAMLTRAVAAAGDELTILAVTVLTSLDATDLDAIGVQGAPSDQAVRLATLAQRAGVKGFVTSAAEVKLLRSRLGADALLVTPGIRPAGAAAGDQKRVATPAQAIADGADILVIGRPLRDAPNRGEAARALLSEISSAGQGPGLIERASQPPPPEST